MPWIPEWSDDFSRANENPATNWTCNVGGTAEVISSGLYSADTQSTTAVWSTEMSSEDMAIEVVSDASDIEIQIRQTSPPSFGDNTRRIRLAGTSLFVAGSYVGEISGPPTGVAFRAEIIGGAVEVFVSGVSQYTNSTAFSSSVGSGNNWAGVRFVSAQAGGITSALGEVWSAASNPIDPPVGYRTPDAVRSFTPHGRGVLRKKSDRQGGLLPSAAAANPLVPNVDAKYQRTVRLLRPRRLAPEYFEQGHYRYRDAILDILSGGGTTTPLNVDGTVTPTGTKSRQVNKALAGTTTPAGVLARAVSKAWAGTVTPTGVAAKQTNKALAGSVTPSGVLSTVKVALLALAGTVTATGALVRQVNKAASGTVTPTGTKVRAVSKAWAGTVTPVGALAKQIAKPLAGTVTAVGVLATIRVLLRSYSGSVTPSGTVARQTNKAASGTVTPLGVPRKQVGKTVAGTVTPSGSLARVIGKALVGTITAVGSLITIIVGAAIPTATAALRVWIIPRSRRTFIPPQAPGAVLVTILTDDNGVPLTDDNGIPLTADPEYFGDSYTIPADVRTHRIPADVREWVIIPTAREMESRI